jgi:AbrB family looped-hinge helix DNA binding protein
VESSVSLDKFGRIVLPKRLRDALAVSSGDRFTVVMEGDSVVLRPQRKEQTLRQVKGIWVLDSDEPVSLKDIQDSIEAVRRERSTWIEEDSP